MEQKKVIFLDHLVAWFQTWTSNEIRASPGQKLKQDGQARLCMNVRPSRKRWIVGWNSKGVWGKGEQTLLFEYKVQKTLADNEELAETET